MRALITGVAGFIGSHLADALLTGGSEVLGVDCITDYYSTEVKRRNLGYLDNRPGWRFHEKRVSGITTPELEGIDVVFHLAAQPGVRSSWTDFDRYVDLNLNETNSLAVKVVEAGVPTVVFASSSSVYGDLPSYPASETDPTRPRSPYGVTKLAGERLWDAYVLEHAIRVAAMRFFTVYGPGQRPDMATQRLVRAALDNSTFTLFGDGEQRRDFTFVTDIVRACEAVASSPDLDDGRVNIFNVGGTGDVSMRQLVAHVEAATGRHVNIEWKQSQAGDVKRTGADIQKLRSLTGWEPTTAIETGLTLQVQYELAPGWDAWRGIV